jgi:beta-glucosidase
MNGGWTITWQGDAEDLYPKNKPTVLQAFQSKTKGKVNYLIETMNYDHIFSKKIINEANHCDVILLCLGEQPYTETPGNIENLLLEPKQISLAEAALATGKPVILLMLGGRPRIITTIAEQVDALILGFLPGMEGADAIASIVYGDYNPNGKLPITYPRNTNGITLYDHKPMEAFELNHYNPLYSFGHGLSYTTFTTTDLKVSKQQFNMDEIINITVKVNNTGTIKGKETVMLYVRDVVASVTRPVKQLRAFEKVELESGESKSVCFSLKANDLSFIGVNMTRIVEPGEFTVMVGDESVSFCLEN